jgi:hypothetical protein
MMMLLLMSMRRCYAAAADDDEGNVEKITLGGTCFGRLAAAFPLSLRIFLPFKLCSLERF